MPSVNIRGDVRRMTRHLDNIQRRQIPFATNNAINKTLFHLLDHSKDKINQDVDRPTKHTQKAFRVKKSSKRRLSGEVFLQENRAYLSNIIHGKTIRRKGLVEPVRIKLNDYGNIPSLRGGKKVRALLAKKHEYFGMHAKGRPRDEVGVWRRVGKYRSDGGQRKIRYHNIYKVVKMVKTKRYGKTFDWYAHVERKYQRIFTPYFRAELRRALATARP